MNKVSAFELISIDSIAYGSYRVKDKFSDLRTFICACSLHLTTIISQHQFDVYCARVHEKICNYSNNNNNRESDSIPGKSKAQFAVIVPSYKGTRKNVSSTSEAISSQHWGT